MSFRRTGVFPPNPSTTRGIPTKLSAVKDKVVYAIGKTVVIRDLNNALLSITYSGHVQNTTVARISPSGYYCASADATGTVKIWDIVGEDQILKGEYRVIAGRVNDLAWDGESKRIIAVGDGREKFGHAFMMDTGSTSGEIGGHSKAINAVSIRHQRPFRAVTAADDGSIVFHQGVPFKYDKTIKTHTKFVQDVRYAPSSDHFASVGSDAKIFLYDGKTGDTLGEFTENVHKGSIMACSWSPDSKSLVTSSADCSVVLWDAENLKPVSTWKLGTGVNHQQVGNAWSGDKGIISLSMSGDLNLFDPRVNNKPSRILNAPQKSITTLASSGTDTFIAGTADGRVLSFLPSASESTNVQGTGHSTLISGLAASTDSTRVFSVGFDDRVREIQIGGNTPEFILTSLSTAAQPKSIAATEDGTIFIAEINNIEAFKENRRVFYDTPKYAPSAIAAFQDLVAIGGEDQKVRLSRWDGSSLNGITVFEGNKGAVTAVAFSPDGHYLASGDTSGKIILFDVQEKKLITSRWSFHTARINAMAWTPDSQHCASASLDTHVYVWSVAKPMKNIAIKNAAPSGGNAVLWYDKQRPGRLATAGTDGCIRLWEVTFQG